MPESIETTSGSVKGSAAIPLAGVSGTAPGSCIVVPPPRHQKTGRVSSRQLLHSTFASTVQTSAAPHHQACSSTGSFAPAHVEGLVGPGRALTGCRREGKGPSWQHAGASTSIRPLGEERRTYKRWSWPRVSLSIYLSRLLAHLFTTRINISIVPSGTELLLVDHAVKLDRQACRSICAAALGA